MKKYLLTLLLLPFSAFGFSTQDTATNKIFTIVTGDNGTDFQAAINAARDRPNDASGDFRDIVKIPSGVYVFPFAISCNKALKITGAGAGGFVLGSKTQVTPDATTKTFAVRAVPNGVSPPITAGETLHCIWANNGTTRFMHGTVSSYTPGSGSGVGSLVFNVFSASGGSAKLSWGFYRDPATTIIVNRAPTPGMTEDTHITFSESTMGNLEVAHIKFQTGPTALSAVCDGKQCGYLVGFNPVANGRAVILHDCWIDGLGGAGTVRFSMNRGLVSRCSFCSGNDLGQVRQVPNHILVNLNSGASLSSEWLAPSTYGAGDTTGFKNLYVEDCYFFSIGGYSNGLGLDNDNNGKIVIRYSLAQNTGFGSHGYESSPFGMRHMEFYNNFLLYDNQGNNDDSTYNNQNQHIMLRGGILIATDNYIDPIVSSGAHPQQSDFSMYINANQIGYTGGGGCCTVYPCIRQVGQGYSGGYITEGSWMWNNGPSTTVGVKPHGLNPCVFTIPTLGSYCLPGRDYFNQSGAKPGYAKFQYPHPLAVGGSPVTPNTDPPSVVTDPQPVTVTAGDSALFTVSAAGAPTLTYQWRTNGVNVTGQVSSTYTINPTVVAMNGWSITCVINNSYGTATSGAALLTVNTPVAMAPTITSQPSSNTKFVGESVTFQVIATGDPTITYQWQSNGVQIAGAVSSTYSIVSIALGHAGTYKVGVTNSSGGVISDDAVLTVLEQAAGSNRYIDFTSGDDANNGDITHPWKHCPGMQEWVGANPTNVLLAGFTVYFDLADTWQFIQNLHGPGFDVIGGVSYIGNVWNPGSAPAGKATLTSTQMCETGVLRFFADHSSYSTVVEGFKIDGGGQTNNCVDVNHAFYKVGGLTGTWKILRSCEIYNNVGAGSAGLFRYGVIISDHSPEGAPGIVSPVYNFLMEDCIVHDLSRDKITVYPGDQGNVTNCIFRRNFIYGTQTDSSYHEGAAFSVKGNATGIVFENNYISNNIGGASIFISGPESNETNRGPGVTIKSNIIGVSTNDDGAIRIYGRGRKEVDIHGNIVMQNILGGCLRFDNHDSNLVCRVYNNLFMNFVDIANPSLPAGSILEFVNNIIYATNAACLTDVGSDITRHDHNTYYRTDNGTKLSIGGMNYTDMSSIEPTALTNNPVFINIAAPPITFTGTYPALMPSPSGLFPTNTSPVIDAGINLPDMYVAAFNMNHPGLSMQGWDMGPYEQLPADIEPPPPPPLEGAARPIRNPILIIPAGP